MRIYSLYWASGNHPNIYESFTKIYGCARDRILHHSFRKKFGIRLWIFVIVIFILLLWQFLWFWRWNPTEWPPINTIDEDIFSKECSNANLLQQYAQAGYTPIHKVTRLKTQLYKPGFCVRYNHWQINSSYLNTEPSKIPILFVVHSTPQFFKYLDKQIATWDGLISLVLVIPYDLNNSEMDLFRMQLILEGLDRLKAIKNYNRVALHLLFERDANETSECEYLLYNEPSADTLWDESYAKLMLRDFERLCASRKIYPINVARNIARLAVKTPLFISGDIENIFSWNYEARMRPFAFQHLIVENNTRTVLVHRRFEAHQNESMPRSLSALRMMFARRRAVVFHRFVFGVGHEIPSLASWLLLGTDTSNPTSIFNTFEFFNEFWEPQYVARNDKTIPLHDESFPFRIRSNTHLANELCRAGFKFSVVKDLFTVHKGIKMKEKKEFADFLKKTADSGQMMKIANAFMDRLDQMYPETAEKCPKQFRNYHWSRNFMMTQAPIKFYV